MSLLLLEKTVWAVAAALGFAILFTVPRRAIWAVALLAAIGYLLRGLALEQGFSLMIATLLGSCTMGLLSIQLAHWVHTPTTVFMSPAVIPMVPGVYAYQFMMGLLEISHNPNVPIDLLTLTASNGLRAAFVILALALGVTIPSLLFRKSVKEIRLGKRSSQHRSC